MKYFNYNKDCILETVELNEVSVKDICVVEPKTHSAARIKGMLKTLKLQKDYFRNLAYKFDKLADHEKLSLIKEFYDFNLTELEDWQLNELGKDYPCKKTIKTDYFASYTDNDRIYKAKATVLAKKDVKFNPLKVYTSAEISKLIMEDKIIPIGVQSYGLPVARPAGEPQKLYCEVLNGAFEHYRYDEDSLKLMRKANPEALKELLDNISIAELQRDYEYEYIPAYKQCLEYLVKCAKVANAKQAEVRRDIKRSADKQTKQSHEETKKLTDLTKEIMDTSKGR